MSLWQARRDTTANWTSVNPILASGEPGWDTTERVLKVGDGATPWLSLTPVGGGVAVVADGDKGDITVSGTGTIWSIDNGVVSLAKMAAMPTDAIVGRVSAGAGSPEHLTAAQVRTVLNVADGATANSADSVLLDRANHTGTQAQATITNLVTDLAAKQAALGFTPENVANRDASGGYAGLTLFKLNLRNAANTITSFFTNANTVSRTYTLPDKDGTVAMLSDIGGTNSGTNTGDVTLSGAPSYLTIAGQVITRALIDLAAHVTGKLPLANIADVATATVMYRKTAGTGVMEAQSLATLKSDLGLTGTNTGDQTITLTGDVTGTGAASFATTVANSAVIGKVLTGFSVGTRAAVVASDSILAAFGKVQKYLNDLSALAFSGSAADLTGTKTAAFISDFSAAADARVVVGIAGKQDMDATLTAMAGLDATAGVIEQTAADTFTKRSIGVATATDILTRGDGDGRFAALSHTHPAAQISDATVAGQAIVTAADASAQTALLSTFDVTSKGLVPAPGVVANKFLRDDGTFAVPSASGGAASKSATLSLPSRRLAHRQVIADAAVLPASIITISLGNMGPTSENEADLLDIVSLAAVPASGSLEIIARFSCPASGPIPITYTIG